MRYITLIFVFLLMVGLGSTARAQTTNPLPGVTCTENGNNGLTHDACVVDTNPGSSGKTVDACKILESTDSLDAFGFTSFGDCMANGETVFGPTLSSFGVFALLLVGWVAVQWWKLRKRDLLCQA
jgi:hypothetical protein